MRTYASMTAMMVLNVLFLKLIISALSTIPTGYMIIPWCLLIVGIARTARKADSLLSKIGINPAFTGDPLGAGKGLVTAAMIARTVMSFTGRAGRGSAHGGKSGAGAQRSAAYTRTGGTNISGSTANSSVGNSNVSSSGRAETVQTNNFGTENSNYSFGGSTSGGSVIKNTGTNTAAFSGGTPKSVNTNRFGALPDNAFKNMGTVSPAKQTPAGAQKSAGSRPDRKTPYNRNSTPDQNKNGKIRFGSEALGKGAVKNKTGFSKPELFGGSPVKPDDVSEPVPNTTAENKEDSKNEQIST